ncbi:tRNA epoxyqueuosine(34) reductase QueG [Accumulibacter sp.]|uniref:tRNA epoxyqueuosine(34) reductase QueG n=1 Tax=Accumulibacter sp. TaxID=2053492 RepID=UPI001AD0608D|nr:tRNA epoxyqueuosine(34) reductase QueG [Accumulibacter sp.]MBN8456145.1 tRNA epoxyqueuosine(34) reductase QueG [Accumulibacter sp.]MBO3708786.1 tRNA epoxyqueuosine(34) reductase QueG [Candidatus Accumulibacter conexus]
MHEENSETGDREAAGSALPETASEVAGLPRRIRAWATELGFAAIGISGIDLSAAEPGLLRWLALGRHGAMDYMAKHAPLRLAPQELLPGVRTVISARLPYLPVAAADAAAVLADDGLGYVSRYALGRDYHRTVRGRLQKLAARLQEAAAALGQPCRCRVFSDSAPVLETEFARQSGVGWRGKHTLSLTRDGSWHFLGEIYCTLPLAADPPAVDHCGDCRRCLDVCPTAAIVAPYEVDARLCISYLTIELRGAIPLPLRPLIGNRIYGCDDCQLCCPWNRFAHLGDADFAVRNGLDATPLATLFAWTESEFDSRLAGSAIRRIGHERWLRNLAVALGNSRRGTPGVVTALHSRLDHPSALVREHVGWALARHGEAG